MFDLNPLGLEATVLNGKMETFSINDDDNSREDEPTKHVDDDISKEEDRGPLGLSFFKGWPTLSPFAADPDHIKVEPRKSEEGTEIEDALLNAFVLPSAKKSQENKSTGNDSSEKASPSRPRNTSFIQETNEGAFQDSNTIALQFSKEMKQVLTSIFGDPGDERDLDEPSDVHVPIWLAQQLFNTWKKESVMENPMDLIQRQDQALGFQDEEIARLLSQEMNETKFSGYGCPPMMFAQDNMPPNLTLQLLHDKYDKFFNPKIIDGIFENCENNYMLAAETLQMIIDDQKPKQSKKGPDGPYLKVVKSAAPTVINPFPRLPPSASMQPPSWSSFLRGEELQQHVLSLRQEAYRHIQQRNELYARAQEVYADKKRRAAAWVYSEMAREHQHKAKDIQSELIEGMLYQQKSDNSLDLHGLTVDQAIFALKKKLKDMKTKHPRQKFLEVITGYGKNSDEKARIKPSIENWLNQMFINYQPINEGAFKVIMKSVDVDKIKIKESSRIF